MTKANKPERINTMKKLLLIIATTFTLALPALADNPAPSPAPDKLQSALADMINKSVQVAGDAKDFLAAQLPDVVKQLLAWKAAESIAWNLLAIGLVAALVFNIKKAVAYAKSEDAEEDIFVTWMVVSVFASLGVLIATSFMFQLTWLQIWLAPKVYLIEYARTFIK